MAGPPVEKEKARCPLTSLPLNVFSPAFTLNSHFTPAGRSRAKSKIQFLLSAHRAVPLSGHLTSNGSTSPQGSPSGTKGSEKRTLTWRTPLTLPWGENISMRGPSSACPTAAVNTARADTTTKHPHFIVILLPIGTTFPVRFK